MPHETKDSLDKRMKEAERTLTREELKAKEKNRAYHDRQAERQISWERAGAKDEYRDRT